MFNYRGDTPLQWDNSKELVVQLIDWVTLNISEDPEKPYEKRKYVIQATGLTKEGNSVLLTINEFPPHFYINIPETFNDYKVRGLISGIKRKLGKKAEDLDNYDVVKRKKFWGFTNNREFKFLRILFKNSIALNESVKILKSEKFFGVDYKDKIYESNLLPFLRFMHINNVKPAGWIKLAPRMYTIHSDEVREDTTTCQLSVETHWKMVKPLESDNIAPMIIASFDIECYSSHGDFPLAVKNYKKLASELFDANEKTVKELKELKDKKTLCEFFEVQVKRGFSHIMPTDKIQNIDKFTDINKLCDVSNVYTIDNETPGDFVVKKLVKELYNLFNTPINYKMLACDVLTLFTHNPKIYDFVDGSFVINRLICEGFSDDMSKNETKILKLYTKVNRKPTERCIKIVSDKLNIVFQKLYNKLDAIFNDNSKVFNLLDTFNNRYTTTIDEKCDYLVDKYSSSEITREDFMKALKFVEMAINQMISVCQAELPELENSRDNNVHRITKILDNYLPQIEGDEIIQIGTTIQKYGEKECCLKHIITLDTCDPIPGAIVESYKTEAEVLLAWTRFMRRLDPDIVTGYNIFGFDFKYLWNRAEALECAEEFGKFTRISKPSVLEIKKLASSALGDNVLSYITMEGRVQMDLLKVIQRDHNLVSYKLDYVAENFMNDSIKQVFDNSNESMIEVVRCNSINVGNFITIKTNGEDKFMDGKKYKIIGKNLDENTVSLDMPENEKNELHSLIEGGCKPKWQLAKDDVTPKQIFEFQKQGADKRQIVAAYCLQDCVLCINIINKLDLITNNIGMANVCSVPLSFIFLRGQGIKIFSLVAKECRGEGYLIPVIKCEQEERTFINKDLNFEPEIDDEEKKHTRNDGGYEGAIVLKPNPGIYLKSPVTVLDYSSLYPSCMISENFSHDSIVLDEKYLGDDGILELKKLGYGYVDQTHDVFKWRDPNIKSKGKVKVGVKTCRFVQPPNGEKSIIPKILKKLLKARKDTRNKIKTEKDEFKKSVYDGLQLAYKVTANSLYGQIGARTSSIYLKEIAASTTSMGRQLLNLAKDKVEEKFEGAKIVYGDTDSIFIDFHPRDDAGNPIYDKAALKKSIDLGVQAEEYIQDFLKPPHKLEYEKTFWPFILFTKKRYIGNKYEFDIDKYNQTSMGIVLKRRDNADIVKHVYGGIIDIIMKEKDIEKSIRFCRQALNELLAGKFPLEMLVITKSLKGYYKNPNQIAHKVLADRMGLRDPGNKPQSNDRIAYAYIDLNVGRNACVLQGDKIENPEYIREQNLKLDYKFYITNQIMKPVCQIYALAVTELEGYTKPTNYFDKKYKSLLEKNMGDVDKTKRKIDELKNKEVEEIVFSDALRKATNKKNNAREITDFFKC